MPSPRLMHDLSFGREKSPESTALFMSEKVVAYFMQRGVLELFLCMEAWSIPLIITRLWAQISQVLARQHHANCRLTPL